MHGTQVSEPSNSLHYPLWLCPVEVASLPQMWPHHCLAEVWAASAAVAQCRGAGLAPPGATSCQMKCDSWERTQHQLMGLKWEQKDLCIIPFGVCTAGQLCGKYSVDAQRQCLCNKHLSRMLFQYDYSFMWSLSNNSLILVKEISHLCGRGWWQNPWVWKNDCLPVEGGVQRAL